MASHRQKRVESLLLPEQLSSQLSMTAATQDALHWNPLLQHALPYDFGTLLDPKLSPCTTSIVWTAVALANFYSCFSLCVNISSSWRPSMILRDSFYFPGSRNLTTSPSHSSPSWSLLTECLSFLNCDLQADR